MSDAAVVREWMRRLDAEGAVEFGRSYAWVAVRAVGLLLFIAMGVFVFMAGSHVGALLAIAVFVLFLVQLLVQATAEGPALRVDLEGVTVGYRTPLRIAWSEVQGATIFKVNQFAKPVVSLHTSKHVVADYRRRVSPWTRTLLRLRIIGPDPTSVKLEVLAPTNELAVWLDAEAADRQHRTGDPEVTA